MSEDELLREFVRVRRTRQHILIEVRRLEEAIPEQISERWSLAGALRAHANVIQVDRARLMTLADYRYFRVCDECGEKHPAGRVQTGQDGLDRCMDCLE